MHRLAYHIRSRFTELAPADIEDYARFWCAAMDAAYLTPASPDVTQPSARTGPSAWALFQVEVANRRRRSAHLDGRGYPSIGSACGERDTADDLRRDGQECSSVLNRRPGWR